MWLAQLVTVRLATLLMRVRPAQLGAFLKRCIGIERTEVTASTGCRYWVDPVSEFGTTVMAYGVYEKRMTALLTSLLHEGHTFVDLGANEGYFAVLAGSIVGSGTVYAVEPQTRLRAVLKRNVELNRLSNVRIETIAISDAAGQVELLLRPDTNTGASSMFRYWKIGSASELVRSITLDDFFASNGIERAQVLKVDCEGAETLIFRGADNVLRRQSIDYIALEYHPRIVGFASCREVHDRILGHGYRLATAGGFAIYYRPALGPPVGRNDSAALAWLSPMEGI